tara:strand:- start:453 stop:836 length:384 start_codon:yes stop_codon:yes gene_type:complete
MEKCLIIDQGINTQVVDIKLTSETHCRVEELRISVHVGHFVTITLNARIYLTLKITLQNVTLGLRFAHECNSLQNVTGADLTVCKLDGIEVNNHVCAFGSELHVMRFFDSLIIHDFKASTTACVPPL